MVDALQGKNAHPFRLPIAVYPREQHFGVRWHKKMC
jgi:hypothetical protein